MPYSSSPELFQSVTYDYHLLDALNIIDLMIEHERFIVLLHIMTKRNSGSISCKSIARFSGRHFNSILSYI